MPWDYRGYRGEEQKEPRQRSRRDVSVSESEGSSAVSEFKVVNPATNQTEREFPAATDAEVEQVLARSARACTRSGSTTWPR
jgi:acyl-CoA reductase-like NAD-dependent aldehyde dehydrogenase